MSLHDISLSTEQDKDIYIQTNCYSKIRISPQQNANVVMTWNSPGNVSQFISVFKPGMFGWTTVF